MKNKPGQRKNEDTCRCTTADKKDTTKVSAVSRCGVRLFVPFSVEDFGRIVVDVCGDCLVKIVPHEFVGQVVDVANIVGEDVNRVGVAYVVVDVIKQDVDAGSARGCVCASGECVCDVRWRNYVQGLLEQQPNLETYEHTTFRARAACRCAYAC